MPPGKCDDGTGKLAPTVQARSSKFEGVIDDEFPRLGIATGSATSHSVTVDQSPPRSEGNCARAPERPDSPTMWLRAYAEWRPFLEWLRGARYFGEGQIALRPVRFVVRSGKLRFDDESRIGGRCASPGNIRRLRKAGQDRTVRRINEHCRWRWWFRPIANDVAVKGVQEERIGVDAL